MTALAIVEALDPAEEYPLGILARGKAVTMDEPAYWARRLLWWISPFNGCRHWIAMSKARSQSSARK